MSTVDLKEISHFNDLASQWWDVEGKFKILHVINPLRISFIINECKKHFNIESPALLNGLTLLDIGCGGGLLSEPLSRLGADVTAIDASLNNIKAAEAHAKLSKLNINYLNMPSEELAKTNVQYDIILAIEVIEHVIDYKLFLKNIKSLLKPGGIVFISTINRNLKSLFLAKIAAEYILNWVPQGTHDWSKFLSPQEIKAEFDNLDLKITNQKGMSFNLLTKEWETTNDLALNYILCAINA